MSNWSSAISRVLIRKGNFFINEIINEEIIKYLKKFNPEVNNDPQKLIQIYLDTLGVTTVFSNDEILNHFIYSLNEKELNSIFVKINFNYSIHDFKKEFFKRENVFFDFLEVFLKDQNFKSFYLLSLKKDDKILSSGIISGAEVGRRFYELHSFQATLKEELLESFNNSNRVLLRVPTGGGKTRISIHTLISLINSQKARYRKWLWVSYKPLLLEQALETFKSIWSVLGSEEISFSIHNDKKINFSDECLEIFFINVSTINNDSNYVNGIENFSDKVGLVVFDEVHQLAAPIAKEFFNRLSVKETKILGLTATPGRGDLNGEDSGYINKFFDELIEINESANSGFFVGHSNEFEIQENKYSPVSYLQSKGYLAYLDEINLGIEKTNIAIEKNIDVTRKILEHAITENDMNRKVVIFANSANHAKNLAFLISSEGLKVEMVLGENSNERNRILNEFRFKDLNILIGFDVLTTGFDAPEVDTLIIARPTSSAVTYSQILGRALRGPKNNGHERNKIINVFSPKYGDVSEVYKLFSEYWRK